MSEEKTTQVVEATTDETQVTSPDDAKQSEKKAESKAKATNQKVYIRSAKGKKRVMKSVSKGNAYVFASLNNTIISVADPHGNIIAWSSSGKCGFKGPKKATPYAAGVVVNDIADALERYGVRELMVYVTGIGNGKDAAIRSLNAKGFSITGIKERTPVPHNGCRPRRARRV
ncbi:MAG: 30S ribosomal protein S11 [bacterium]|nr:30S ribosomal protein S11 [bacterium]MDA1024376.1 30S ribosomal protein S11 [bacterium]